MKCKFEGCEIEAGYASRCKEHWACDKCGSKEDIIYSDYGILCEGCYKKLMDEKIANFFGNTYGCHEIICPYCGYEFRDSWEHGDDDTLECGDCYNVFSMERYVDVTYSTEKIEE